MNPSQPMTPLRVALYLRVSTDEQAKEGYGLVYQEEKLRAFVASQAYLLQESHVYRDEGFSGSLSIDQRPGLSRLFDAAQTHAFEVVLVYRLDRFFRQTRLLLDALERLNHVGVGVRSITEPFDTTNITGRFMTTLLGAVAEMERDTIRERTMHGRTAAARAGQWPTGVPPYGYRYHKPAKRLEIEPDEAKWVKQFVQWLVMERLSLSEIQRRANDLGVPPPWYGRTTRQTRLYWHKRTIGRILVNEAYTGRAYFRKYKRPFRNLSSVVDPTLQRNQEDWIPIAIPPLISSELFDAAKQQLLHNREFSRRNRKRPYLYSQLLYCGSCGFKLFGGYQPPRQPGHRGSQYYHGTCRRSWEQGTTRRCAWCTQIAEVRLEPIWETLKAVLEQPEYLIPQLHQARADPLDAPARAEELAEIEQQLAALTVKKRRWAEAYAADPGMTLAFYTAQIKECEAQALRLQARREQVQQTVLTQQEVEAQVEEIKPLYARLCRALTTASYETKQQVLRLLVHKIVVYAKENRARVELKFPDLDALSASDFTVQDFQLRDRIPEPRPAILPTLAFTVRLVSVLERRQIARLNNPAMQKQAG